MSSDISSGIDFEGGWSQVGARAAMFLDHLSGDCLGRWLK